MNELILLKDLGTRYTSSSMKYKEKYGLFKCHCGNEFETVIRNVKRKTIKSCGCSYNTHGLRNHVLYYVWKSMRARCYNKNAKDYIHYGGRGITICNEWLDIQNFINDMYPTFEEGLTLDRIDVNGNYCKENCRWTNRKVQSRNTRKIISSNTSGYRGVYWHKRDKVWVSAITVNYKRIHLGYFDNPIVAATTYDNYVIKNNLEHTRNFTD